MHTHRKYGHLVVDAAVLFVAVLHLLPFVGSGIEAAGHAETPVAVAAQVRTVDPVCFPAESWGAKDGERPCARIVRVFEDGSVRIVVSNANGTFRYAAGVGARDR